MSKVDLDLRAFLAMVTVAMAIAFGIGVAYGPVELEKPSKPQKPSAPRLQMPRRSRTKHLGIIGDKISDLNEVHVNFEKPVLEEFGNNDHVSTDMSANRSVHHPHDKEENLPAGQHLMVDISNVEAAFLNSESRLADAMVQSVLSAGFTMLSYHCHSLLPAGVSCVGVLRESHISFHTWPDEGVITLDMFTCGPKQLLPAIKDLERLFGIPRKKPNSDEYEEIIMQWSHELRGFRTEEDGKTNYLHKSDLATWVVGPLFGKKKEVLSKQTKYHQVDIWDVWEVEAKPTHHDAIAAGLEKGDPRWKEDSDIITPRRNLFLNGVFQSDNHTAFEFIETLVQPAMFAHQSPKNAAIIGGGDGAALREILKHKTIENAIMIELDEEIIQISREFLPSLSDCSHFDGLADNCFDDNRVNIVIDDARSWFKQNYGKVPKASEKLDVIIFDVIDPKHESELYDDPLFLDALYDSLNEDGVMAVHIGKSHIIHDPKPDIGVTAPREHFMRLLESHRGTAAVMVYEEGHNGFDEPHMFLVVCKKSNCRSRWNAESMVIDDEIYDRIRDTKNNEEALIHFDGTTQRSYHIPPKTWETVYCRREPTPFECAYRDLDKSKGFYEISLNEDGSPAPDSAFEMRKETLGEGGSSGIYALVDIPAGSYIMPSDVAASFTMNDAMLKGITDASKVKGTGAVSVIEDYLAYVAKNGHKSMIDGMDLLYIEVGGSTLIKRSKNPDDVNVGQWMPPHPSGKLPVHSPVYDRRQYSFEVFLIATKDIKAGEEIVREAS